MFIRLDGDGPAWRQIYRRIREAILEGKLVPGSRLPATRRLAGELGVARITVVQAYEQLAAEGYLDARAGAGTRVAATLHGLIDKQADNREGPAPRLSAYAGRALDAAPAEPPGGASRSLQWDFQYGQPEAGAELLGNWRRALRRAAGKLPVGYPDPRGEPALRECLATYLREQRGILADPKQIMVAGGTQQALELIGRCVIGPGDRVVIEEPHYQGARHAFEALGANLVHAAVDEDGLQTDGLPEDGGNNPETPVRLAYITPSHQFPLGGVLPVSRRLALLQWASRNDAFIIEDDYDSEYRHAGIPLQSLYGLDRNERVIYVGSVSKVLFPALRLGYVVLPISWIEPMRQVKWIADRGTTPLEQLALAELFRAGDFRRHIKNTARKLSQRRQALVAALETHFGTDIEILGTRSGMHLVVRWPELDGAGTNEIVQAAARHGVGVYPTNDYYDNQPPNAVELLLGYATLTPADIQTAIRKLFSVYAGVYAGLPGLRPDRLYNGRAMHNPG